MTQSTVPQLRFAWVRLAAWMPVGLGCKPFAVSNIDVEFRVVVDDHLAELSFTRGSRFVATSYGREAIQAKARELKNVKEVVLKWSYAPASY